MQRTVIKMFNSRRGSGITITSTTVNTKTMGFIYCVLYEQWADMNVDMEAYTTFTLNLWDHYIIVLIIRCFDDCWHVHLNNIWKTMANGSPIGMNCLVIYTNKDIACFCQQYTTYIIHFSSLGEKNWKPNILWSSNNTWYEAEFTELCNNSSHFIINYNTRFFCWRRYI